MGKVEKQADEVGLAGGGGFAEETLELVADGAGGDAAEGGDFFDGVAGEEAVGDFGFGRGKVEVGAHEVVAKMDGAVGVGDEEEDSGFGFGVGDSGNG